MTDHVTASAPSSSVIGKAPRAFLIAMIATFLSGAAAVEWFAWAATATLTPRAMAQAQLRDPHSVIFPNELKYFAAAKLKHIEEKQPEIISIGSSRCNEIRSRMFRPYTFYNACLTAWSLPQITRMLDLATQVSRPRVVIVSLDYFLFTDQFASAFTDRDPVLRARFDYHIDALSTLMIAFHDHFQTTRRDLPYILSGGKREPTDQSRLLGLVANRAEAGFRYDGSMMYSRGQIASAPTFNADRTYGLIQAMPGGPQISPAQMANLEKLAALARDRGVTLVGLQLPILGTAVDYLDNEPGYRPFAGVWREFQSPDFRRKVAELGIVQFDLSRDPVTADPRYFLDPAHPNEAAILGALTRLFDDPRFRDIFPALDVEGLKRDYAEAMRSGTFFDVYRASF